MRWWSVYACLCAPVVFLYTLISAQLLQQQTCQLIRPSRLPTVAKEGNITLGALFSLHDAVLESELSFTSQPEPAQCTGSPLHALRTAVELMGGREEERDGTECQGKVPVVIGDGGSTLSLVVAHFLGVFQMPQLVKHFGWTWVGTVAGDDAYGRGGAQIFNDKVTKLGACIGLYEIIPKNHAPAEMARIVQRIGGSGARVVLVFALEQDAKALFSEALKHNLTGVQWLASEAWITAAILTTPEFHSILQGSMGFAIRRAEIPSLQPFLLRLHPSSFPDDPFVLQFWEEMFRCSLQNGSKGVGSDALRPCNGSEELASVKSIYSDVSQLRISYNVYKAVYAIAHALDAILRYAVECVTCPPEFWSNLKRDACIPKLVEFLSYGDTMGMALLAMALLGSCATLVIGLVFACKRHTPLVSYSVSLSRPAYGPGSVAISPDSLPCNLQN
ncbi:hypothetical protein MHYP_G00129040 [Metynnis hypsauchen]